MKKVLYLIAFFSLFISVPVKAVCPVCTVAVVGGLGLSRWLGIDDTITGIWIGGLTFSLIIWTIEWFNKKNIKFLFRKISIFIGYYALIVLPLFWIGIIGIETNKLWGIDKLLLGIILGSILFVAGAASYPYFKNKELQKAYFPFQRVVMAVTPLIIFSIIFYFLT